MWSQKFNRFFVKHVYLLLGLFIHYKLNSTTEAATTFCIYYISYIWIIELLFSRDDNSGFFYKFFIKSKKQISQLVKMYKDEARKKIFLIRKQFEM